MTQETDGRFVTDEGGHPKSNFSALRRRERGGSLTRQPTGFDKPCIVADSVIAGPIGIVPAEYGRKSET